jgi:hypothetical protein
LKEQGKCGLGFARQRDINLGDLLDEAPGKERESGSTEHDRSFGSVLPDKNSKGLEVGNERDKISCQRVEVPKGNTDHIGSERIESAHQAGPRKRIEVKIQALDLVLTTDRRRQSGETEGKNHLTAIMRRDCLDQQDSHGFLPR